MTYDTLGQREPIQDIHDFRTIDIEKYSESAFSEFAGEVMLLRLATQTKEKYSFEDFTSDDIENLRKPDQVIGRKTHDYKNRIRKTVKSILPSYTQQEMASNCLHDPIISKILVKDINESLQKRNCSYTADFFVDKNYPQASVVCASLLSRQNLEVEQVRLEYEKLKGNKVNNFNGGADWINNNFVGAYLRLYQNRIQKCPFFSGFESFCSMANGNIRYFLELCHNAVKRHSNYKDGFSVDVIEQSHAAYLASEKFVREVRSCGQLGNQLYAMVLTLGGLFSLSQRRMTQSEPEVSQFSVKGGDIEEDDRQILKEAIKWSVLFEERENKVKGTMDSEPLQWIFNPMYAPFFRISFRKKRKLELDSCDLHVILNGDRKQRDELLDKFEKRWRDDTEECTRPEANQGFLF